MATGPSTPSAPAGFAATAFFSKTYAEAQALLLDARDYIRVVETANWGQLAVSLVHSQETLRLTTRLTQIMAWLLVQRAVHAGEISRKEALAEQYRLGGQGVCFDDGAENSPAMPVQLRALLRQSRRLYRRIARLDEMIARDSV